MQHLNFRFSFVFLTTIFTLNFWVTKINAQWSELGGTNSSTFNRSLTSITTDSSGNVYTAGDIVNNNGYFYVGKWNGINWTELGGIGSSTFNNWINCLVTDANGNVYTAGNFTNDSGKYYVAKWDGNNWSELGGKNMSTFNSGIMCMLTDISGNVYAAGGISNSKNKQYVAKWNGISWVELGGLNTSTFNSSITCITKDSSGNLFAAGYFKNSKGKQYVAKWNGNIWSELGGTNSSTFNNDILSLTTDKSSNVYASGYFTNGTSVSSGLHYVAKWNGNNWIQLGGINVIYCLITDIGGTVYGAGSFTNGSKNNVARLNDSIWQELGGASSSPFNSTVRTIVPDVNGNVYASGSFTNASGKRYVAKYTITGLPVKLINISAIQDNKDIVINWLTAREQNTSYFILQHSIYGTSFKNVDTVKAIGSGANAYEFTDNKPDKGINYYRLQSVDKDGSSTNSKVVSVDFGENQSFSIIPNPAKDFASISFSKLVDKATIEVYDLTGKAVITKSLSGNTNTYKLNTQSLKSGLYVIKVTTATGNYNEKLLISK